MNEIVRQVSVLSADIVEKSKEFDHTQEMTRLTSEFFGKIAISEKSYLQVCQVLSSQQIKQWLK